MIRTKSQGACWCLVPRRVLRADPQEGLRPTRTSHLPIRYFCPHSLCPFHSTILAAQTRKC